MMRDKVTGDVLKVGHTTGGTNIYRRFNWYRRKAQEFGVKAELEYWEVANKTRARGIEDAIRVQLEKQGFSATWDKMLESNKGVPWRGLPWQRASDSPIPLPLGE